MSEQLICFDCFEETDLTFEVIDTWLVIVEDGVLQFAYCPDCQDEELQMIAAINDCEPGGVSL